MRETLFTVLSRSALIRRAAAGLAVGVLLLALPACGPAKYLHEDFDSIGQGAVNFMDDLTGRRDAEY